MASLCWPPFGLRTAPNWTSENAYIILMGQGHMRRPGRSLRRNRLLVWDMFRKLKPVAFATGCGWNPIILHKREKNTNQQYHFHTSYKTQHSGLCLFLFQKSPSWAGGLPGVCLQRHAIFHRLLHRISASRWNKKNSNASQVLEWFIPMSREDLMMSHWTMFEFAVLKAQVVTTRQNFHIQCKTNTSFNHQFQGGMEILAGFWGRNTGQGKHSSRRSQPAQT